MTLRSNDQFNTTIHGHSNRFRGVEGAQHMLYMNEADIQRLGLGAGVAVDLEAATDDGVQRGIHGLQIIPYDIPAGCVGAYFPECNPPISLWHLDAGRKVPGYEVLPARIHRSAVRRDAVPAQDGLQRAA